MHCCKQCYVQLCTAQDDYAVAGLIEKVHWYACLVMCMIQLEHLRQLGKEDCTHRERDMQTSCWI